MQHITVVPYDPAWEKEFEKEAAALEKILGEECLALYHIGSTAVPGLKAKPIIDILAVVRSLDGVDERCSLFEKLGYECMGEMGIRSRRYFRKGGDERTHQIHIFEEKNQKEIRRHLAVRDYLRGHRAEAEAYGSLKARLAEEFPYDIEGYCQGKDAFVKQLEEKALLWRKQQENRRGLKFCKLRNCPKLLKPAAEWFAEKWGIAEEIYLESIERCLRQKEEIPQWYVLIDEEGNIAAGAGMIDNDFHSRKDLTPNLCALYVEERYRNRGLARWILDEIRAEAGNMGYDKLYLVTDHMGFYERCGWKFLTMAKDQEAMPIRLYEADTREIEKD